MRPPGLGPQVRLVALAAVVALGCAGPRADEYEPYLRIVALRHQTDGGKSMAGVPSAEIGHVRRPVLLHAPTRVVLRERVPAGTAGPTTRDVDVPEAFRQAPVRMVAVQVAFTGSVVDENPDRLDVLARIPIDALEGALEPGQISVERLGRTVRDVAQPGGREAMPFDLVPAPSKAGGMLEIAVTRVPETEYVTPSITLPTGARLRLAMGVDRPSTGAALPVTFSVGVIDEDGGQKVLLRRALDPETRRHDRAWVDAEVGLERWATRSVRLRFRTEYEAGAGLPRWGDPTIVVPPPSAAPVPRRNLLLVSLDTLRADRLGCYGYKRPTSPVIDALAAEGAVFERAYAAYPQTDGSHASMLTGLAPCLHGVSGAPRVALRRDAETLAEHLRAAGWATGAVTEDGMVSAASGFSRGFETWAEHRPVGFTADARSTFADGIAWMRRHRRRPWFLFLHTYQTHQPYRPPPGYLDLVAGGGGKDPADSLLYDAEIRYTDELLGDVLAELAAMREADDTLIVLVSDHGEHFGEHGLYGHSNSLYDELLHVPWVLRAPGLVPAGKRVSTTVGIVDLVPTLLDLLDVEPPKWSHGRSVVPLLNDVTMPPVLLFADGMGSREVAIRSLDWKWIVRRPGGPARVFELAKDPGEDKPVVVQRASLLAEYDEQCDVPPAPPLDEADVPPDAATVQKLRSLGYLQ
jgi:arylsulfatase A-like enzyme